MKDAVIVKHNGTEGALVFVEKGSDVGRLVISGAELPEGFALTDGEGSLGSIKVK